MIYKKSVVLSSVDQGNEKGVVTLEYNGGDMLGTVRLYNFDGDPDGILSVGIYSGGEVIKAGLTKKDFSCALVNLNGGEAKPLLFGSTNKMDKKEEALVNSFSIFDNEVNVEKIKKTLDDNGIEVENDDEVEELIDKEISNVLCENKCGDCKYRDAFFKLEDDTAPAPEPKDETFFDGIKGQIEELFGKYPEEEILKDIIPNSKWVKIDYEDKGEYYVVGLLYEDNKIKYVCYGVPSMYSNEPPEDLKGFSQWLPLDASKENGFGYWITYQDADTGENVNLDYETV